MQAKIYFEIIVNPIDKPCKVWYSVFKMITKRIQKRNEAILRYRQKGYTLRAIGKIVHKSHTWVMNTLNNLKEEGVK